MMLRQTLATAAEPAIDKRLYRNDNEPKDIFIRTVVGSRVRIGCP